MVEPERSPMTTRRMGVACWIIKATRAKGYAHTLEHPPRARTHTRANTQKYVNLIAFRQRASYIAFLVNFGEAHVGVESKVRSEAEF